MSSSVKNTLSSAFAVAFLLAGGLPAQAADTPPVAGASPALCGPGDVKEPGLQGDVAAGLTAWKYNCGVKLIGELPLKGNVQGVGSKCVYVRTDNNSVIHVIDISDPRKPKEVRSVPAAYKSETMRVVVTKDRAVMVSGSSVYDIKDCLDPRWMGEIKWPPLALGRNPPAGGGGGSGMLPHDLRLNHAGTKVYGSFGLWEVDITNLKDPASWKVTDLRCDILAQIPGPWQAIHEWANKANRSLCADAANPNGANYMNAASGLQSNLIWPQLSHSLDTSGDDTKVFVADQAPGGGTIWQPTTMMRIIDVSQKPAKFLGQVNGPGHSVDWFRAGGRDYVVHANERGSGGAGASTLGPREGGDPCQPYPRSTALGWAFEALVSDVTNPTAPKNVAMLQIGINDPARCDARKASGRDPTVAYHLIDNPMNAKFVMVNFGSAGLRIYDIRQPEKASEVAYFNQGLVRDGTGVFPVHGGIGHYDAARGLIYAAGSNGLQVLEIEPQVRKHLGL